MESARRGGGNLDLAVTRLDGPYRLSEARDAFRHFGAGHHQGKVVITMD